jgi:hypothetical protein
MKRASAFWMRSATKGSRAASGVEALDGIDRGERFHVWVVAIGARGAKDDDVAAAGAFEEPAEDGVYVLAAAHQREAGRRAGLDVGCAAGEVVLVGRIGAESCAGQQKKKARDPHGVSVRRRRASGKDCRLPGRPRRRLRRRERCRSLPSRAAARARVSKDR